MSESAPPSLLPKTSSSSPTPRGGEAPDRKVEPPSAFAQNRPEDKAWKSLFDRLQEIETERGNSQMSYAEMRMQYG